MQILDVLKLTSTVSSGLFAGGALYINAVEHPSRRALVVPEARKQWADSFDIASKVYPGLGTIYAACSCAIAYLDTESPYRYHWLVGLGVYIAVGVYSVVCMFPEIRILKDEECLNKKGHVWVKEAIGRWNARHMFRTFCNCSVFGLYTWLLMTTSAQK